MEDHKGFKSFCLADPPRLVSSPFVDFIPQHDRCRVNGRYGDWNADVEDAIK